jgi:nicotinic acid mononucleotide adenylyltransferase
MKTLKELLRKDTGRSKPVVFAFGRLNPPTIGHQKLIERIITVAKRVKGLPVLYVSASQDKKKNPLTVKQKVDYLKKLYPRGIQILPAIGSERTFMEILKNRFDKRYTDVYMIAGSDRVAEFKRLIKQYNGKDYNFDTTEVVSAGERDPDATGATGMSASKMREFAARNDFTSFKQGLIRGTKEKDAMKLFKDLKKGMGVNEAMAPEDDGLRMIRENYHNNEIFNMGDMVENNNNGNVGKIIKRGPNYVQYEMEDGGVEKAWLNEITPANNIDTELQVEDVDKKKLVLQKNAKTLKSFSSFEEEINSAKDVQKTNKDEEEKEQKKADKQDRKLPIETPGQPKIASVDTWTQGPENANQIHTQRKFNIKTPGQVRDYAKFVDNRKFQKFEEVDLEEKTDPKLKLRYMKTVIDMLDGTHGKQLISQSEYDKLMKLTKKMNNLENPRGASSSEKREYEKLVMKYANKLGSKKREYLGYIKDIMKEGFDLEESLRGSFSDKQLANLKKVWAKKTKRDVTPAIKKLLKNLDAPTRAAIANAKINVISKMVPEGIEEKGLWHNIHMKRKRGETMRKKGEKGAPTPQQMARAKAASEDPEVRQDPDVKDKKGTQPAKYYSGIKSKSTKSARDAHFKKGTKMDDDNPAAYKPAPGDASGETKPSKHTIAFKKKFGEDVQQEIKDIKAWSELDETIEQYKDQYGTEYRVKLDQTVSEMFDELLSENEGVKKKAAKSGMPYGVLMKVYNRGMAAWRTGHRPGTTPQQWGMARVNSFVTKSSGTWGKADSDLAAKVRGK